ncbi:MAG: hypothetical protein ABI839_02730 [Verrucomicrobiota bacterium]
MRTLLLLALLGAASPAWAQEQERKLVDRLLEPNTKLANADQGKKFMGERTASTHAQVNTRSFYVSEKNLARNFADQRSFATATVQPKVFQSRSAYLPANSRPTSFATKPALAPAIASEAAKSVASRGYAGNRAAVVHGKSQKALDRRNPPLTIEQVRELLNKNE